MVVVVALLGRSADGGAVPPLLALEASMVRAVAVAGGDSVEDLLLSDVGPASEALQDCEYVVEAGVTVCIHGDLRVVGVA